MYSERPWGGGILSFDVFGRFVLSGRMLKRDYPNYLRFASLVLFAISPVILVDPLATYVAFLQTIILYGYFLPGC